MYTPSRTLMRFLVFAAIVVVISVPIMTFATTYSPSPDRPPTPAAKPSLILPYSDPSVKQVAGFGTQTHNDVTFSTHTHYALDFATAGWGEFNVRAAAAGILTYATWDGSSRGTGDPVPSYCPEDVSPDDGPQGRVALVNHGGGWYTVYHHLASYSVPHNTQVQQGQQIGVAGCSGTKWRHLHFELRHYDPEDGVWTYNPDFGTTPEGPSLDLVFVIDTTGSMFDDIARVKADATTIINTLVGANPNTRIAVVDYRDFPSRAASYDYPYRDVLSFTYNSQDAINAIQSLSLGWGGDAPETANCALLHVIDGVNCAGQGANTSVGPWASSNKRIILMTDAPALDPEPFTGYTKQLVADRANAGEMELWGGYDEDSFGVLPSVPEGIVIDSIIIGGSSDSLAYGQFLADNTGGNVYAAATAEDVVDALLDAIGDIVTPPEPAPTCETAVTEPGLLWPPNNAMYNVAISGIENADQVVVDAVFQDEPVGNNYDATLSGTDVVILRAQRNGSGDGRVYHINFTATGPGGTCQGTVKVIVPHDMGVGQHERGTAGDGGPLFQSTAP